MIALIAVYEALPERFRQWRTHANLVRRLRVYVISVGLTTVVASLAPAPFAIYHFNRFAIFGLIANLIAVPVMAMWVMPWAMLLPSSVIGRCCTSRFHPLSCSRPSACSWSARMCPEPVPRAIAGLSVRSPSSAVGRTAWGSCRVPTSWV